VFALASVIGLVVRDVAGTRTSVYVNVLVLAGALILDVYAVRKSKWCPVTVRRQAPQGIMYELGMKRAAAAWGLDAGLVFSTYRVSAVGWAVILGCLTGIAPWWTGAAYAGGFLIPLAALSCLGSLTGGTESYQVARMLGFRHTTAKVIVACALAASLAALLSIALQPHLGNV
jgi:hypothetical protein